MTDPSPPAEPSKSKGPLAVIGVVALIILPLGAVGHYHATRNSRRHDANALTGQQLYTEYCARCHLPTLTGDGAYPSIVAKDYTLDVFTTQVRDGMSRPGVASMPSFKATFDAEDYARLHAFVVETRKAAPR